MSASKLDAVYRSFLLTKFFTKGWGKPENLRRLFEFRKVVSNREECFKLVEKDYPVTITKEQNLADCKLLEGYFLTPLERYLPGIVPEIVQKAHFQALLPIHWPEKDVKPVCLHLAGTGDHFFWRRRNLMVKPLIKEAGIGGIILENPFYGLRKPTDQIRSSLHNVSDIFVMGGCLILEALVLFHWCERNGLGPLGVTGLSMGGHMASLAATNWPKPLVLVPCLSWSTASAVFLQGVMSQSINWDLLEHQYLSDGVYRDKLSKMVTIVDEAFLAGKKFARTYSETVRKPENNRSDTNNHNTSDTNNHNRRDTNNRNQNDKNRDRAVVHPNSDVTNSQTSNSKKVDITYKELNQVVDVSKSLEINSDKVPNYEPKSELTVNIECLYEELKKLLEEKKINLSLYNKLLSNEHFVLDPDDIEDINKLTEERLKEVLLKCKIAFIKQELLDSNRILEEKEDQNTAKSKKVLIEKESKALVKPQTKEVIKPKEKSSWNISDLAADWIDFSFLKGSEKKIDISKIHWRDREALQFMRGVMDECTHLSNFSVPFDTSLIIAVCAQHDAYVPRDDVGTLEEIWPGAEVRYVDAGHVSAYILHQSLFRSCIREAFERSKKKWKEGEHIV